MLEEFIFTRNGDVLTNDSFTTITSTDIVSGSDTFVIGTLQICSVTVEDDGEYECRISNEIGTDSVSFIVDVITEPGKFSCFNYNGANS